MDLLDVFIKKQPRNPLIIYILVPLLNVAVIQDSDESQDLHSKIISLMKTRVLKLKECIPIELDSGLKTLKEIHEVTAKAPTGSIAGLCSTVSIMVVKSLAQKFPESAVANLNQTPKSNQKKKQKLNINKAGLENAPMGLSPIATIYLTSLKSFITEKKSKINSSLFIDLANRYPLIAFELAPSILEFQTSNRAVNGYRVTQGFSILSEILKRLPPKQVCEIQCPFFYLI
jgi:DNA polymerase phi